jgi:hypothetical protein
MHVYWSLVLTAARNLWHQLAIAYQYTVHPVVRINYFHYFSDKEENNREQDQIIDLSIIDQARQDAKPHALIQISF